MAKLLVIGNPVDGFTFQGPYDEAEDALQDAELFEDREWWVADLVTPEAEEPVTVPDVQAPRHNDDWED